MKKKKDEIQDMELKDQPLTPVDENETEVEDKNDDTEETTEETLHDREQINDETVKAEEQVEHSEEAIEESCKEESAPVVQDGLFEQADAEEIPKILVESLQNLKENNISQAHEIASLATKRLEYLNMQFSEEERLQQEKAREELKTWAKRYNDLFTQAKTFSLNIQEPDPTADPESKEFQLLMPEIQQIFFQRKKSVDMIRRMASRLEGRQRDISEMLALLDKSFESKLELVSRIETSDSDLLPEINEIQNSLNRLCKSFRKIRDNGYYLKRDLENATDDINKMIFDFLSNQFFPVADSIDRGLREAKKVADPLSADIPQDDRKAVNEWVDIYETLYAQLESFFSSVGIERITAETGEPFDGEIHFAISTESSRDMENELILEISRPGYRFQQELIRPAEVVVVKN